MWATCLSTPLLALWPNVSDYIIYQIFMKFSVRVCYKRCYLRVSFVLNGSMTIRPHSVCTKWLSDSPTSLSLYQLAQWQSDLTQSVPAGSVTVRPHSVCTKWLSDSPTSLSLYQLAQWQSDLT
jgi:hypothetical protein